MARPTSGKPGTPRRRTGNPIDPKRDNPIVDTAAGKADPVASDVADFRTARAAVVLEEEGREASSLDTASMARRPRSGGDSSAPWPDKAPGRAGNAVPD